jgi:hypothetical protein
VDCILGFATQDPRKRCLLSDQVPSRLQYYANDLVNLLQFIALGLLIQILGLCLETFATLEGVESKGA